MNEVDAYVVAIFRDGSVLRRYSRDGQYWQEKPDGLMYPAQRLAMKRAADRVVWQEAQVVTGAPGASRFYAAVERARVEWLAERAARAD